MAPRALAAAQTTPVRGDVDANVAEHVRLAHVAAEERAQVVVFPEMSLTGYELDLADDLAFTTGDPRLATLMGVATSCSMTLIIGAPARIGSRLHIGAFIVSPDGPVELYTKHHLGAFPGSASPGGTVPPAEATLFHPGDRNPLVRFHGNTAALAICADTGRAAHALAAADRGAKAYLASMFVIPADLEQDLANLGGYASRHSMAVVMANFGGPSGGLPSGGCSAIWSERGELLSMLEACGTGVAVASEVRGGWRSKAIMLERP